MGFVQSAFAASQILGIPLGLYFSTLWGWHAPFMMIVVVSIAVGFVIFTYLKPVDGHLNQKNDQNAFLHLISTLKTPRYLVAFLVMALLSLGGYMLMPFGSAFTVNNLGIDMAHLPMVYLVSGITMLFIGPVIGKATDSLGKWKVFLFGATLTIIMVLIYTNLGITPLAGVIVVNSLLFLGIFSRIIPAQAIISAIPSTTDRGSFMAVLTSLQQIAGGLASFIAGSIVVETPEGQI